MIEYPADFPAAARAPVERAIVEAELSFDTSEDDAVDFVLRIVEVSCGK